jgi:hypothetical protein
MKNEIPQKKNYALLAGLLFCAAGIMAVQANSLETFSVDMSSNVVNGSFNPSTMTVWVRGTFDNWSANGTQLQEVGLSAPYIYTNTVNDTINANGNPVTYVFLYQSNDVSNTKFYESLNSGYNRDASTPSISGGTVAPPTPYFGDLGAPTYNQVSFAVDMSEQIYLGNFKPGAGDVITVEGNFVGWTHDVLVLTNDSAFYPESGLPGGTNQVYGNTFYVTNSPNAVQQYKFVIYNTGSLAANYENVSTPNKDPNSQNRFFAGPQASPLSLSRVYFGDQAFSLVNVSNLTFSVDMTIIRITDTNFNPNSVTINGDFCGWGGVACTNSPTAANTNIYTVQSPSPGGYTAGLGATLNYQYRYTHLSDASTQYDHANGVNGGQGNRTYLVGNTNPNGANIASVWNDAQLNDYILIPTAVFFSVDMNGAVGTDSHAFNPASDDVYINGTFAGWYAWSGGANPSPAPPGYQMVREGSSTIYTNTIIVPPGPPDVIYKYGMDIFRANGGPADDEAGFGVNHARVIRNSAFNPYQMATDTFSHQYNEPFFSSGATSAANLKVGPVSGGKVLVTWLGRPGAHLQTKSSLTSGSWVNLQVTDGTNWTTGAYGTNGFVSSTNYPVSGGATFFRLVKP